MMAATAGVSMMIMYEDESVDVRYGDGSRLQLSPCGCEFMLVRAPDPSGHPLQSSHTVRQRTRFTTSTYKELMEAALVFRNKYAARPYLPEELVPAVHRKPFFIMDSDVEWPEASSCRAQLGPAGETVLRSVEGRAALTLSSSGEDFCVQFWCGFSRHRRMHGLSGDSDVGQKANRETKEVQGRGARKNEPVRARSCSPRVNAHSPGQPKPEEMYRSTAVVQHHSCSGVAPMWRYPLSLARHHWTSRLSKPAGDPGPEGAADSSRADGTDSEERMSRLPEALPLACASPHWHRWRFKEPVAQGEEQSDQDPPGEPVKVMWCHGVVYRILGGAPSVVEVSPGDGSVIRSNGALSSYFTHHKTELQSGRVKEVTYHLNSLPPDVAGQLYSVGSVVGRASRILACYDQARHSLKHLATPSCLQQHGDLSEPATLEENLPNPVPVAHHLAVTQTIQSRSNIVAAELEKIKRFNYLLENSNLPWSDNVSRGLERSRAEEAALVEPVSKSFIADALQRTSKAIQDIDALISATTLT